MAQPHDALDVSSWQLGAVVSAGKNERFRAVHDGLAFPPAPPKLQLSTDDDPPLEVAQVDRETGSLTVRVSEGSPLLRSLLALDDFALRAAERHTAHVFQRAFDREQLARLYRPLVTDGRLSLALQGSAVRVWRLLPVQVGEAERRVAEASLDEVEAGSSVWLCAEVRGMCFQPRSFSLALAVSDVMLLPGQRPRAFPFQSRKCSFAVEARGEAPGPAAAQPAEKCLGDDDPR